MSLFMLASEKRWKRNNPSIAFLEPIQHVRMLDINMNFDDILVFKAAVKEWIYEYSELKSS